MRLYVQIYMHILCVRITDVIMTVIGLEIKVCYVPVGLKMNNTARSRAEEGSGTESKTQLKRFQEM